MNSARSQICRAISCVALFVVFVGLAGLVHGQSPFTDSVVKPTGIGIPRGVPRGLKLHKGLDISILYHEGNRVETSRLDVEKLLEEDASQIEPGPLRIGVVQEFEPQTGKDGQWTEIQGGGHLWTMAFRAPEAVSIRLRIRPWSPPSGAELFLYDAHNPAQSFGPLDRMYQLQTDTLWTPIIYSDEVCVEYYIPPEVDHTAPESWITIDGLLNQYRNPLYGRSGQLELPCHLDVTCYSDWVEEASGVGALSYVSDRYGYFCTACLLNRIPTDYTPFLQTSWHCGVDESDTSKVESLLVTWFYQTDACNGAPPNPAMLPQTSGVIRLVHESPTDYSLIGLSSDIPAGVWYLGWDASYWKNGSASTGVHHPGGTQKRITFGTKIDDLDSWPKGWYITNPSGNGEIEPGSSGSPIFDSAHRVRGPCQGADWDCNTDNIAVYGRFDITWPKLQPYLQPNDPIYVDGSFTGEELGTQANPFTTVHKGVFAVISGSNVYIDHGTYSEQFTIVKPMTLRSRNGSATIGRL